MKKISYAKNDHNCKTQWDDKNYCYDTDVDR